MSSRYYSEQLYPLQDEVLRFLGSVESPFYLTGGTLLGRYLLHHRFSDDLDFFVNDNPAFAEEVNRIMYPVVQHFPTIELSVRYDTLVRYFIHQNDIVLKVEFINDVPYRVGSPQPGQWVKHDTWLNVLSNKVTALPRSAAKDVVDIVHLCFSYSFNWEEVISHAKCKDASVNEIDVSRSFYEFDLTRLREVSFLGPVPLWDKKTILTLARESLHGLDNSLAIKN